MDINDVAREIASLRAAVETLKAQLSRTAVTENAAGGGGGGWTAVDASTATKGIGKLSYAPDVPTNPIAVGDNDPRNTNSRSPNGTAGGSLAGTYPNPTLSPSGVTPGTYTNPTLTLNAEGRATAAASSAGSTPDYVTLLNTSGSTIPANKLVAIDSFGIAYKLADSGTTNDFVAVGFSTNSVPAGFSGVIQLGGVLGGFSSLVVGAVYFSDPSTPGGITTTPPSTAGQKLQIVGRASANATLLIEIQEPILVVATPVALKVNTSTGRLEETNALVNLQATSPGAAQTGSARVSLSLGADTRFYLNTVPILESGTAFPTSGLVDGQRYRHMTYRSWFVYNLTDTKWRQEAPGVFGSSFPTVASGDNTLAPNIEVSRRDLGSRVYFWDGAVWQPRAGTIVGLPMVTRILNDTTSRASGYANSAIQVAGAADILGYSPNLPAVGKIRGVWFSLFVIAAAGTGVSYVIENPDSAAGAITMQGTLVNVAGLAAYSGSGYVTLSSLGRIRLVQSSTANVGRTIIDIQAYLA